MTVKDLYNILEKEIDNGNLTVDSEVWVECNDNYLPCIENYHIAFNLLALHTK